jgi:hypothetical protein
MSRCIIVALYKTRSVFYLLTAPARNATVDNDFGPAERLYLAHIRSAGAEN